MEIQIKLVVVSNVHRRLELAVHTAGLHLLPICTTSRINAVQGINSGKFISAIFSGCGDFPQ